MASILPHQVDPQAPWLQQYPSCVPASLKYPDIPVWGLLDRSSTDYPDRDALIYYRERITYRELYEQSVRMAAALRESGIGVGDRVGILMPNTPEFLIALNATWMAGGIAVALSPLLVANEVSDLVKATDCRTIVSLDMLAPLAWNGESRPERMILTSLRHRLPHWQKVLYTCAKWKKLGRQAKKSSVEIVDWQSFLGESTSSFTPITPDNADQAAYLLPTGGTTGSPKIVQLTHRSLVANAWQLFHWAGSRRGDETMLSVLPFFHSYGLTTCATTGIALAATLVLHHRFQTSRISHLIEKHRPTFFPAVPAMLAAMNEFADRRKVDWTSIRFCMSGGAPLDTKIAHEFSEETGAIVVEGYGLSEASPVTHAGPLDMTARPGTIGLPLPDTDVKIVNVENPSETVATGEVGEVLVRGPQLMSGYWKNPEATNHAIRDGWLRTGDLGTCDEDGFFRIVDRKKDLIITSGFNVYPTDVEHVLRKAEGVVDVAVIGTPDAMKGERVEAIVVVESESSFDREAFDAFCCENLAKHKRPHEVRVQTHDLPRNFLGKVLRRELRIEMVGAEA